MSAKSPKPADALAWLVEDGLASTVTVAPYFDEAGELAFDVDVARPTGTEQYRVAGIWDANLAPSEIDVAQADADQWAAIAAALESDAYKEIPEIY